MKWVLGGIAAIAAAYQLVALIACVRHKLGKQFRSSSLPGVSILKPVRGLHAGFDQALQSHLHQNYPVFELLCGYRDPNDSAIPSIERAGVGHFVCTSAAANAKVGVLMDLVERASFPIIIVNDADIVVPPEYIRDVTAPLADPNVGLVTCLYRAVGDSWPSRFEALGVATDFAPSALVAPLVGVSEFGFGSTLAFRRADLDSIGGFAAVADYLADDYQLGEKIHQLGRKNLISSVVVETRLHADRWSTIWSHQVRWARTIRCSRRDGYLGLPITFASFWALAAALAGMWWTTAGLLAIRLSMAIMGGWFVIRSRDVLPYFWLVPARDLYGVAVWVAGLFGNTVEWGGRKLHIDSSGRIRL